MKKFSIALFLTLATLIFCSCGMGYPKVNGIIATVVIGDDEVQEGESAREENGYLVKIGERYQIVLRPAYTGGSRSVGYGIESAANIKLTYDENLLEIGEPTEKSGRLYYPLFCKKECARTAVRIETSIFQTQVILSSENQV